MFRLAALGLSVLLALPVFSQGYTYVDWADGLHGRSAEGRRLLHVETDHYAAVVDVERAAITRYGMVDDAPGYAAAVKDGVRFPALPEIKMALTVEVGGETYTCVRAAQDTTDHANYPIRLIDGGRMLHRFDILGLEFETADGEALAERGRLEISVWPERMWLTLELPGAVKTGIRLGDSVADAEGARVSLVYPPGELPRPELVVEDAYEEHAALPVRWDPLFGASVVTLPSRQWNMAEHLDRLDRFPVRITNDTDTVQTYPVVFAFEESFEGVTGLSPMLRDAEGNPSGIPVQISKNWHRGEERLLYEGPWFNGVAEIPVAAGQTWTGELAIAYASWGGVPAASHAQLCLVGWGGNQRWDQAAIGSFGESICYDPDVGLNRSHIDDVRPLMVRGMRDGRWEWTHNVGGGNFLLYADAEGQAQPLIGVRAAYLSQGPNLTRVVYGGTTADGSIVSRVEASTPRCDDVNRAYHRIRYDVRKRTPFSRLAFYQLGADNYNDHQFTKMAHGNAAGLTEEWTTERGGKRYLREAMPAEGDAPWIALLGGIRPDTWKEGAWADRALVVRAWNARLGGEEVPVPYFASYGTENGPPSANAEMVPPPGVTELLPGDYVEAEIELLVLPQQAEDYYGPNAALRAALGEMGGTWKLVHRFAAEGAVEVDMTSGTLRRSLPVEIEVDAGTQSAACEMSGGVGYVPITFHGLKRTEGYVLTVDGTPLDQAVDGNDFWQVTPEDGGTWAMTFNVDLDGTETRVVAFSPQRHRGHGEEGEFGQDLQDLQD
ncbi:MAG: hypothetical protein GC168_00560 [Candidatus Hydrogenedens sp.]|nr:hypothetical protein [Candidatus Hydrogenedens sp.]